MASLTISELGMNCSVRHGILFAEHESADFDSSDTKVPVQRDSQRLSWKCGLWNVGEEFFGIEVDRVAADGFENRYSASLQQFAQIANLADTEPQIFFVENLLKSSSHRF